LVGKKCTFNLKSTTNLNTTAIYTLIARRGVAKIDRKLIACSKVFPDNKEAEMIYRAVLNLKSHFIEIVQSIGKTLRNRHIGRFIGERQGQF